MSQIDHFAYGFITPGMAYFMSVVGSSLGLISVRRARASSGGWPRARWLILAATTIGGSGIWLMHFLGMIGFSVKNVEIRYNLPLTVLSAVIAIVVVGFGLFVVCHGERSWGRLLLAGFLGGIGIAGMHYAGMAAMELSGTVEYALPLVGASVIVAIIAVTTALWFALTVDGWVATVGAALIMGIAVAGMHYTAMASVSVTAHEQHNVPGTPLINILLPVFLAACVVLIVPLCVFLALDTEEEAHHRRRDVLRPPETDANLTSSGTSIH